MHAEHTSLSVVHKCTHTHPEINSFYGVYSFVLFCFFFLGIHTCVGAPTLRQRSQFKHIKSTADYVCRYYPKNQRCAFSKETQTITDLITPELYHSCCSVFTLSDMAETTAQIRTERRFPSQLSWLAAYHKPQKSQCQTELGMAPKSQHTCTKANHHHIEFLGWISVFIGSSWECFVILKRIFPHR